LPTLTYTEYFGEIDSALLWVEIILPSHPASSVSSFSISGSASIACRAESRYGDFTLIPVKIASRIYPPPCSQIKWAI
jgi:hypothetical protein